MGDSDREWKRQRRTWRQFPGSGMSQPMSVEEGIGLMEALGLLDEPIRRLRTWSTVGRIGERWYEKRASDFKVWVVVLGRPVQMSFKKLVMWKLGLVDAVAEEDRLLKMRIKRRVALGRDIRGAAAPRGGKRQTPRRRGEGPSFGDI